MKPRILFIATLLIMSGNVVLAQEKGGCDLCGPSGTTQNTVIGNYAIAAGMGNLAQGAYSMAVGMYNKAMGAGSFALGKFVRANSTGAFVIGSGLDNTDAKVLKNNYANTLVIGFNSKNPTLFVGSSNGGTTTGKIGIGNVTNPLAKLHMRSDSNEDAGLILETTNKTSRKAFIQLYDASHKIEVSKTGMNIISQNDALSIDANRIKMNGKVGINTDNTFTGDYDYTLAVNGGILTSKVYVKEVTEWHDAVFSDDYTLMSLEKLQQYISENRHLPDLPSEQEVLEKGYDVAYMEGALLKKIEELTLYTIDLQRQLQSQQKMIKELQNSVNQ